MIKTIVLSLAIGVLILNSGCGKAEASTLDNGQNPMIFQTDSVQYEMAAQLCDAKSWNGSVCPALLNLTQDLDAGVYARYPSTEEAASSEVSRMVLRVIAMDSLATLARFQETLALEN